MNMYERENYYINIHNRCVDLYNRVISGKCKCEFVKSNLHRLDSISEKYMDLAYEMHEDILLSEYLGG